MVIQSKLIQDKLLRDDSRLSEIFLILHKTIGFTLEELGIIKDTYDPLISGEKSMGAIIEDMKTAELPVENVTQAIDILKLMFTGSKLAQITGEV